MQLTAIKKMTPLLRTTAEADGLRLNTGYWLLATLWWRTGG